MLAGALSHVPVAVVVAGIVGGVGVCDLVGLFGCCGVCDCCDCCDRLSVGGLVDNAVDAVEWVDSLPHIDPASAELSANLNVGRVRKTAAVGRLSGSMESARSTTD